MTKEKIMASFFNDLIFVVWSIIIFVWYVPNGRWSEAGSR